MLDWNRRLAALAEAAGAAASPQPATAIRARAGRMLRRRRIATIIAVVLAVGGIAVATAQAFPGSRTPVVAVSPSSPPSASRSQSPSPSPSPSASSAGSGVVAPCRAGDVAAEWGGEDSGSTHRGVPLILTNTLDRACRLSGYPVIVASRPSGSPARAKSTRTGYLGGAYGPPAVIDLASGEKASAYVEALAIDPATGNGCGFFTLISVQLAGDGIVKLPAWSSDACGGLEVHPFVAGRTGRQ